MVQFLLAGVAVAIVVSLLNLALCYGVIRRLRVHEEQLAGGGDGGEGTSMPPATPGVGSSLPDFHAVTQDGRQLDRALLGEGRAYIGFFSAFCPPCRERLPEFVDYVEARGELDRTLVVVSGAESPQGREMVEQAQRAAHVVTEAGDPGALELALEVDRLPCMLVLDDGVVQANGAVIAHLLMAAESRG